ncbi:MAG: hypothetical protein ACLQGJ_04695 [Candidatus Dormibacteria bacterium]
MRVLTVLCRGGREVGRRERLYGIGGDRLCLDRYLVVLWCKPRALAGSLGLRQAIDDGSFPVSYAELHCGLLEQALSFNAQMSSLGGLPHTVPPRTPSSAAGSRPQSSRYVR